MDDDLLPGSLTFVIPVYNEEESLKLLYQQIHKAVLPLGRAYEIIFVDDGSTDGSWWEIERISHHDESVLGIKFQRNFGKAAALAAGFSRATCDIIFTLDADLQDDPVEVPQFLKKLAEGYDVVSGWKKIRHDPWHKVFPSRVFNGMVSRKTGVHLHDHNCGYKAFRRAAAKAVHLYGERHRFIPVLAAAAGFRIGEIAIQHRPRQFGYSKYGWRRFTRGYLDLQTVSFLTKYRYRPMHFFGTQYLILLVCGVFSLLIGIIVHLGFQRPEGIATEIIGAMAIIVAALFYVTGLIAELMIDRPGSTAPYLIERTIGTAPDTEAP